MDGILSNLLLLHDPDDIMCTKEKRISRAAPTGLRRDPKTYLHRLEVPPWLRGISFFVEGGMKHAGRA